jgi:hypothetical protein
LDEPKAAEGDRVSSGTESRDQMIFFSEKSLRKAVEQYVLHFKHERNHQGLDNLIPFPHRPQVESQSGLIVKSERLGGLLNYYYREAKEVEEVA